mmetsp:Transcript_962/g.2397  ORF Transcript_962/g.2397 Transcript_962/m.2397 type:complete len:228 (-) Transcript_962:2002-2685(-)
MWHCRLKRVTHQSRELFEEHLWPAHSHASANTSRKHHWPLTAPDHRICTRPCFCGQWSSAIVCPVARLNCAVLGRGRNNIPIIPVRWWLDFYLDFHCLLHAPCARALDTKWNVPPPASFAFQDASKARTSRRNADWDRKPVDLAHFVAFHKLLRPLCRSSLEKTFDPSPPIERRNLQKQAQRCNRDLFMPHTRFPATRQPSLRPSLFPREDTHNIIHSVYQAPSPCR